jgi:glycosyltransferase involved in cell wall biosynthesis
MDAPQITVAMPVYNGEGYVNLAIQSVLDQTYSDFELLIVNNCSTDGTLEVVKAFSDPRTRLHINSSNLGMVGNWNRSIELATGKLKARIGSFRIQLNSQLRRLITSSSSR